MIAMVLSAVFAKASKSRDAIAKDSNTTHRDADQEGVEPKLHALLSPRILGESTRWDCSKLNCFTQAPNKLFLN